MPLNRRVPFFHINRSQKAWETQRQNELKRRSHSQFNNTFHRNGGDPFHVDETNQQYPNDYDEDDLQSDKLFHTICVGTFNETSSAIPGLRNAHWMQLEETIINLFKNQGKLEDGKLKETHDNLQSLLDPNFGILVFERLKSQVLPKAVRLLKVNLNDDNYLEQLESIWKTFYHQILSTLECMLFSVEPINNVSIRETTLVIFRDQILVNGPLESKLKDSVERKQKISDILIHMILIVQSIMERYPPSHNKLQMELMAALVITPFVGYHGVYENYCQIPVIKSKEPLNNIRSNLNGSIMKPPSSSSSIIDTPSRSASLQEQNILFNKQLFQKILNSDDSQENRKIRKTKPDWSKRKSLNTNSGKNLISRIQ